MNTAYVTTPAAMANIDRLGDDDRAMVAGCIEGDRRAMADLYRCYQRRVFNLVARMVGPQEAEELTQDAFVRVFRGMRSFRGDAALGTWIYRLAMNVCLSYLSKRSRRSRLHERYENEHVVLQSVAAASVTSPDNSALRQQLERALSALPSGYRAVLVLHDVEGLNHREIGEILGCREGTSKSQLHKARMKMRELLQPSLGLGDDRSPGSTGGART